MLACSLEVVWLKGTFHDRSPSVLITPSVTITLRIASHDRFLRGRRARVRPDSEDRMANGGQNSFICPVQALTELPL